MAVAGLLSMAIDVAVAWTLGYGLGIWVREQSKQLIRFKVMAVFAFPFFCWLPITLAFTTLFVARVLPTQPPLSWMIAILIDLFVLGLVTILWKRGQYLERKAQNPLHGILPQGN